MAYVEKILMVEGMRAHYLEGGAGYPLLLIHGSGPGASTIGNWRRILDPLAEQFHVFALDLFGFGRSERKSTQPYFDVPLWLRQCVALLEQMPGDNIGVLGHSLSGALALKLAAMQPRIAQVLTTATMGAAFAVNEATRKIWTFPATRAQLQRTAEILIYDVTLIDDAYLDARVAILHSDTTYGNYFSTMFSGDPQRFADATVLSAGEVTAITCEISMLHGRNDVAFPASISLDLAERLPQADVTLLANCSHSIAMEHPQKLLQAARALFAHHNHAVCLQGSA